MAHLNVEIKARTKKHEKIRALLIARHADYRGIDHQVDTYFNVPHGRLKLREGKIENFLIQYERANQDGPKQSDVVLYKSSPGSSLKEALSKALGVLVVVDKQREIYFLENVKFHLDTLKDLGTFVEIEAIDKDLKIGRDKLLKQCNHYMKLFDISPQDLISVSYSDMILQRNGQI